MTPRNRKPLPSVEFLSQYTLETHSDHRALIVHLGIVAPNGKAKLIRFATWNAGNGTRGDLEEILTQCDVLFGQEWGDRRDLKRYARRHGFRLGRALRKGSKATPTLHRREMKRLRSLSFVLLLSRFIGPGAGPSRNKQKNAEGYLLSWGGVGIEALSFHASPTQGKPLRKRAALDAVRNLVEIECGRRFARVRGCDLNAVPFSPTEVAWRRGGWMSNQRKKRIATHGNRAIDYIAWPIAQDSASR